MFLVGFTVHICQRNTNDLFVSRSISHDELLSITAPLKPLEHCTGPFLEKCDENDNGIITLEEWGMCLGLEEGEFQGVGYC